MVRLQKAGPAPASSFPRRAPALTSCTQAVSVQLVSVGSPGTNQHAMTELTADRLRALLHYDYEAGVFTRRVRTGPTAPAGAVAGVINKRHGYVQIWVDGSRYYGHRLAFLYMTGAWPTDGVDHRDGVCSNNRWSNLRPATQAQNRTNQHRVRSDSRSGFLGVKCMPNGKHRAIITVAGKQHHLGMFVTAADAHAAYLAAKPTFHPFIAV